MNKNYVELNNELIIVTSDDGEISIRQNYENIKEILTKENKMELLYEYKEMFEIYFNKKRDLLKDIYFASKASTFVFILSALFMATHDLFFASLLVILSLPVLIAMDVVSKVISRKLLVSEYQIQLIEEMIEKLKNEKIQEKKITQDKEITKRKVHSIDIENMENDFLEELQNKQDNLKVKKRLLYKDDRK